MGNSMWLRKGWLSRPWAALFCGSDPKFMGWSLEVGLRNLWFLKTPQKWGWAARLGNPWLCKIQVLGHQGQEKVFAQQTHWGPALTLLRASRQYKTAGCRRQWGHPCRWGGSCWSLQAERWMLSSCCWCSNPCNPHCPLDWVFLCPIARREEELNWESYLFSTI